MNYRASVLSRVTLETDQTIGDGKTITIFGITVANTLSTPVLVDIQSIAGNNRLSIAVECRDTVTVPIEWIADGGLLIDGLGDSGVIVTVFHSQAGS